MICECNRKIKLSAEFADRYLQAVYYIISLHTKRKGIMTNLEKYINSFVETFDVPADKLDGLEYQGIEQWDSVGHMSLIAALEDAFDIMMDTDDIIDFSSFEKGKEILSKPEYGVEF